MHYHVNHRPYKFLVTLANELSRNLANEPSHCIYWSNRWTYRYSSSVYYSSGIIILQFNNPIFFKTWKEWFSNKYAMWRLSLLRSARITLNTFSYTPNCLTFRMSSEPWKTEIQSSDLHLKNRHSLHLYLFPNFNAWSHILYVANKRRHTPIKQSIINIKRPKFDSSYK